MKLKVSDKYKNCKVCMPDEVIHLSGNVPQYKLKKLKAINHPAVEVVEEKPEQDEKVDEG